MKAEHRHELKTNELAEWLNELPEWATENLRTIIVVCVVVVAAAGSFFYIRYQKDALLTDQRIKLTTLVTRLEQAKRDVFAAHQQGADSSYELLKLATDIKNMADRCKDNALAALGYIKYAEAIRAELHYQPKMLGERDVIDPINKAKTAYNMAIERAPGSAELMATAKFGLGLCEEELGNVAKAKELYNEVSTTAAYSGIAVSVAARQRLETVGEYQQKVVFKPARTATPVKTPSVMDRTIGSTLDPTKVGHRKSVPLAAPVPNPNVPSVNVPAPAPSTTPVPETNSISGAPSGS